MNRRNFLKRGSLSSLSIAALTMTACTPPGKKNDGRPPDKEEADQFPLNELTVDELQEKMSSGKINSRGLTELYLSRIKAIDQNGPRLNAVIELNPDALEIADQMDRERKEGKIRGPLHGIPILIKDNIDTADKMMTTAGALAMVGNKAAHDAFIVTRLREAGAVLLGKTNLSEWANFRSSRSSSGWSSRGGQTRNPYVLDRNPCGSSSGSGAAVSANLCAIAVGTETNGSIACPGSINGVVGLKPTVGLWSRAGIIPISATQDTAGPLARTVRDAALLLGALAGTDKSDPATLKSEGKSRHDYTSFLDTNGLKGKRIGIEKSFMKGHEGVDALFEKAIEQLKSHGAELVVVELMKETKVLDGQEFKVLKYEFKDGLNRYLAASNAPVKSLQEIIDFNTKNEAKAMPYFKQETLEASQKLGGLDAKEYTDALSTLLRVTRGAIDKILTENKLDAICAPTDGPSWCTDLINGDAFSGYGSYSVAAMAGYPSITVPMGFHYELPIGLTFFSTAWDEGKLLTIAYAYEQASKNRKPPKFRPTI